WTPSREDRPMLRSGVVSLAFLAGLLCRAEAYGPQGHGLVGAIADQRLAGKAATKIADLLDGLSLAEAALLADNIKDWDRKDPKTPNTFPLPDHPEFEAQLVAFFRANPPKNSDPKKLPPNHHWFHYTDVPVTGQATYRDGSTGRNEFDVVHMISFCVKVLKG